MKPSIASVSPLRTNRVGFNIGLMLVLGATLLMTGCATSGYSGAHANSARAFDGFHQVPTSGFRSDGVAGFVFEPRLVDTAAE